MSDENTEPEAAGAARSVRSLPEIAIAPYGTRALRCENVFTSPEAFGRWLDTDAVPEGLLVTTLYGDYTLPGPVPRQPRYRRDIGPGLAYAVDGHLTVIALSQLGITNAVYLAEGPWPETEYYPGADVEAYLASCPVVSVAEGVALSDTVFSLTRGPLAEGESPTAPVVHTGRGGRDGGGDADPGRPDAVVQAPETPVDAEGGEGAGRP